MKTLTLEHKTSSEDISPGSIYWKKLTLDAQISNYMIGTRALGYEPDGILYDVLRKPANDPFTATPLERRTYTKPTKKDPVPHLYATQREVDETPLEYRDRLLALIAEKPDYYYQRGVVVRLEDEERDAAFDTWQVAERIRLSRHSGRWPRNVDSCSQYHRMCDYWEVCTGETTITDLRYVVGPVHPELSGDVKRHPLPLLTTSSARTYNACAKRYQFAYEMGVRRRETAGALRFGTLIHLGLETWLLSGLNLDAALAAMRTETYDFEAAKAEAMMRGYDCRWRDEPLEVLAVEKEFSTPLLNPETGSASRTFLRAGKLDAVVRRHDRGVEDAASTNEPSAHDAGGGAPR
jgi:PD-(D/E)XK nuclease superfamily